MSQKINLISSSQIKYVILKMRPFFYTVSFTTRRLWDKMVPDRPAQPPHFAKASWGFAHECLATKPTDKRSPARLFWTFWPHSILGKV